MDNTQRVISAFFALILTTGTAAAQSSESRALSSIPWSGAYLQIEEREQRLVGAYGDRVDHVRLRMEFSAPVSSETHQATLFRAGRFASPLSASAFIAYDSRPTLDELMAEMGAQTEDCARTCARAGVGDACTTPALLRYARDPQVFAQDVRVTRERAANALRASVAAVASAAERAAEAASAAERAAEAASAAERAAGEALAAVAAAERDRAAAELAEAQRRLGQANERVTETTNIIIKLRYNEQDNSRLQLRRRLCAEFYPTDEADPCQTEPGTDYCQCMGGGESAPFRLDDVRAFQEKIRGDLALDLPLDEVVATAARECSRIGLGHRAWVSEHHDVVGDVRVAPRPEWMIGFQASAEYARVSAYPAADLGADAVDFDQWSLDLGPSVFVYEVTSDIGWYTTLRAGLRLSQAPEVDEAERCTALPSQDPEVTGRACGEVEVFAEAPSLEPSMYAAAALGALFPGMLDGSRPGVELRAALDDLGERALVRWGVLAFVSPRIVDGGQGDFLSPLIARFGVGFEASHALYDRDPIPMTQSPAVSVGELVDFSVIGLVGASL